MNNLGALGEENGKSLSDNVDGGEIFKLTADEIVVALFGLLKHFKMSCQQRRLGECGAVYAAKHLVFGISAPISTGALSQLKGLDRTGGHKVRAGAKVGEISLLIEGNFLALAAVLFYELHLIWLVFHKLFGVRRVKLKTLESNVFLDDFFHLGLDFFENFGGKMLVDVKIIIKSVLNGGSDAKLDIGEKALHGLSHDVGSGVIKGALTLLVVKGQKLENAVVFHGGAKIAHLSVDFAYAGGLVKAHTDRLCDFEGGGSLFKGTLLTAQITFDFRHIYHSKNNFKKTKHSTQKQGEVLLHGST